MGDTQCPPVTVEGDWSPDQNRTVKNKLHIYFQSKKRSSGGDCQVEVEDGGRRACVFFRSREVRERVLQRKNHEIVLGNQTLTLRLSSAPRPTNSDGVSDPQTDSKLPKSEPEPGASAEKPKDSGSPQRPAVVLENIPENMSRDLLLMLVENVSGSEEDQFSLEIIWESNMAVVTFNSSTDVEKFISVSPTHSKIQKHGLKVRRLEATKSVRVESLPPAVVKEFLELWFEKDWVVPDDIVMIPEEQAAIVTFSDARAVGRICVKVDHVMRSIPVKLYPYYQSLGTALYGKERPSWKMPESFTEKVQRVIWKFLLMKKLLRSINDQMRPHFCSVELDEPEVKLRPLPSFLRQKALTAAAVDGWKQEAQQAFCHLMSQFSAFECDVNADAWKAAEKEVRSFVKEDAVVAFEASREVLIVAGRADDMKIIRAPVENIVLKAISSNERKTKGLSETMCLTPAMFYILKHEGLQKAASDISPELELSYDGATEELTIKGLPEEVYRIKSWILESNTKLKKKQLNVPPGLLEYLRTVDHMEMSRKLFTSQDVGAVYSVDSKGVFLLGSSDRVLVDAESKMKAELLVQTLDVKDQKVLNLQGWTDLNRELLDTYNCSKKKTVNIWLHPERRDKVSVAGFVSPVKEVGRVLKEFVENFSEVQETLRVQSCAVVQFVNRRTDVWKDIAKDHQVSVAFDPERPKILVSGARLHVQRAKSSLQELVGSLHADTLTVDKPGAKKYFQSQGSMFLSSVMLEFSCVVMLQPDVQDEEEDGENRQEGTGLCYCRVRTSSGAEVSVSRADICSLNVDAVVNAANEDLQHIGGLALALLKAAGPQLQKISNDVVAKHGKVRPGDAVVTDACSLPSKYVVHAVGPRYSDYDKKTAVLRLKSAVRASLRQAGGVHCSSVALPAISSGVFGFPVPLCAETIAQAVREYCDSPAGPGSITQIHLVDNNDDTVRIMAAAVNGEFIDLEPTMTVPQPAAGKNRGAMGGHQRGRGRGPSQSPKGRRLGDRGAEGGRGGRNHHVSGAGQRGSRRMEQTTPEGLKVVLCKGNIQDQTTDVIVNTIDGNMNLEQGAVSRAIAEAAGEQLQVAVLAEAGVSTLRSGDVVVTDGYGLSCRKVFHVVCPYWDDGGGQAEKELTSIVSDCLEEAEKSRMTSLSFPAIGTGNLRFPRDLVSRVLLTEVRRFSRRKSPLHLREVVITVHPSDGPTVDCFTREFSGEASPRNLQREEGPSSRSGPQQPVSRSQQSSTSFSSVQSPSLGVYRMQMGQLTLEVSSGDITKEACDVIINSSNQNFDLYAGVSKAILDCAGFTIQRECSQIVSSPGFLPRSMILTSAGQLPSRNIVHVVGQNDPVKIKDMVYGVLKFCEESRFTSVAFPALGTGQGGVDPAAVADSMVDAVVDFVRKKHPKFVCSVKILIFQTAMMNEFHRSMKKRQGQEVEKSIFGMIRDFFGFGSEQQNSTDLVLEKEEFEAAVFQLCADNQKALNMAKKQINELIVAEQASKTISDQYINQLTQADVEGLQSLQRELTVSIRLDKGQEDQEPKIHLEGLTRDVHTAESTIRDIIRKVERKELWRSKAVLVSGLVEWQYQDQSGSVVPFDIDANLQLEEALEKKQSVKIKINNDTYVAKPDLKRAFSEKRRNHVELIRKDKKKAADQLPSHWDDMKKDIVQLFPVAQGSQEYNDVLGELTRNGLALNIIQIERVQNSTLWLNYQLLKKQMEVKNNHKNNEKVLFHGTAASSIDLINSKGFNRSYAGMHGAMFGKGSYFAVDPAYSAGNYAKPDINRHKRMYQARVLVGDYTQGSSTMIAPPARSGSPADLYDSVADRVNNPSMFIIFNDIQAYPEYLITFT